MKQPETRYAKSGDVRIAYQVVGQGPLDLVFVPGFISNLEVHWEDPGFTHLLSRLSTFTRLIMFDKRGTGLSDRVDTHHLPDLETRMTDVRVVMDAVGSTRAALLGASEGGPMSILFAATYPERTRALILYGSYAHFHTWVMDREALEEFIGGVEQNWGTGANAPRFAPEQSKNGRFPAWWGRYERLSASPNAAIALARMNAAIDVRPVLGKVHVPTLVIHRRDDARIRFAGGKYLASKIKGARFVELPGRDHPIWTGHVDPIVDEIEQFLTGARPAPVFDGVLATVLVARLVASARFAARLGDGQWNEKLARFRTAVAEAVTRCRGVLAASGQEETIARFDSPARAVHCAVALRSVAQDFEIELAAGVHTGEIVIEGNAISGLAAHVTGQISQRARAHEILVSRVVTDLVIGAGVHFKSRDDIMIESMEHPPALHAIVTEHHLEPAAKPTTTPNLEALSSREHEVLSMIARGLNNPAIAEELKLSDHTVKRHVANILLKLNLPTRAAAAALIGRAPAHRGL